MSGERLRAGRLMAAIPASVPPPPPRNEPGRPCIRGTRFRVMDLLELLAAGASHEEVLRDYPFLEPEDIRATLSAISMLRRGGGLG